MPQAKTAPLPLSNNELRRLTKIKPVMRFKRAKEKLIPCPYGELYYIEDTDPHDIRFLENAHAIKKTGGQIQFLADIKTIHSHIHPFKPSIAEVLAQIPEEYVHKTVAFEIIGTPEIVVLAMEPCYKAAVRLFKNKKR